MKKFAVSLMCALLLCVVVLIYINTDSEIFFASAEHGRENFEPTEADLESVEVNLGSAEAELRFRTFEQRLRSAMIGADSIARMLADEANRTDQLFREVIVRESGRDEAEIPVRRSRNIFPNDHSVNLRRNGILRAILRDMSDQYPEFADIDVSQLDWETLLN